MMRYIIHLSEIMKKILYALFFTVIVLFLSIQLVFADIYKSPEEIEEERKQFNALPKCLIDGYLTEFETKTPHECSVKHILQITTPSWMISVYTGGSSWLCDGWGSRNFFPYYDKNYNQISPTLWMRIIWVVNTNDGEILEMWNAESSQYWDYPQCSSEIIPEIFYSKYPFPEIPPLYSNQGMQKVVSDYFYYHYTKIFYCIIALALFSWIFIWVSGSVILLKIKNKKST